MTLVSDARQKSVDILIPAFDEEEALPQFHQNLCGVVDRIPYTVKIYYINDGSKDQTGEILASIAQNDPRVVVVELSRNFGHQAALTAGLDLAQGDAVITMDADGQHPPEMIPEMLKLYEAGYDIVYTQRVEEKQPSSFKRWSSAAFYRTINQIGDTRIIPGSADYRLTSQQVVSELRKMREYQRFLRGMISWMGYRSVILPFLPAQRIAGQSKYSLKKMVRLAMDATFSFSLVPLQIGLFTGVIFFVLAAIEVLYVLSLWLIGKPNNLAPGWSSLMFMLLIVGGTLMFLLSFIGIYIGYIFQEVKSRPIYIIRTIHDHAFETKD